MLAHTVGAAEWVLVCGAVSSALVRLILGVLAAHAARVALRPSDASQFAHRLAVLRALLDGSNGRGPGRYGASDGGGSPGAGRRGRAAPRSARSVGPPNSARSHRSSGSSASPRTPVPVLRAARRR